MRLLKLAALVAAFVFLAPVLSAFAHDPYTGKVDPVFGNGCCGGADCAILEVEPGMIEGEMDGYRIRLTTEDAQKVNPYRTKPVDTLITWDRIQPSWDGNYHLCLRTHDARDIFGEPDTARGAAYCFWAPPNT
jgi:hypothetical protein